MWLAPTRGCPDLGAWRCGPARIDRQAPLRGACDGSSPKRTGLLGKAAKIADRCDGCVGYACFQHLADASQADTVHEDHRGNAPGLAKDLVKAAAAEIADAGQGFDGDRAVPMRPDILGGTAGLPPCGGLRFVAQIAESSARLPVPFSAAPEQAAGFRCRALAAGTGPAGTWTCAGFIPVRCSCWAAFCSKATGDFQPNAECLRRGL